MKHLKTILLLTLITLNFTYTKADPVPLKNAINSATRSYLELKNALVTGNVTTVQTKAMDFIRALNSVPDVDMTIDQHKTWFDYLSKLVYDARHISESGAIDHQREHFSSLSENMFTVLKRFNMNSMTLYKQYSPLDKYYWISETATFKNPYNGNGTKITSGETREVLKAK